MKNLNWKILSSEYLLNDLWFKVRRDICETPGGKIINPYYVYEFPNWVTAVPVTEDGKVILVHQYRHALGEVCLEIPGGCVDDTDKNFEDAIARELLEETGYSFSSYEYLGKISANPSTNNNLMHMFLTKGGKKISEQKLDGNEEIEVELFSMDEVKQLL
ncbi:MAG TPA: NUDIX hydrolase, partial [Chitinophagaceae bacterium]|nr:NUDIX hydrolase [Chitinophagaceae bacterium]